MNTSSIYTFGENALAARRLKLLADAFEVSTVAFLEQLVCAPQTCLDLGCGPGATTRLLHQVSGARRSVGIDRSARLLEEAKTYAEPRRGISFLLHDLEQAPYPVEPAELVHMRFLLTHFNDPGGGLLRFGQLLAPGGRMMVQEVASLHTEELTFQRYYELVRRLQTHHGQDLEVGRKLSALALQTPLEIERVGTTTTGIPARVMAELHAMNLSTWRREPFAVENFNSLELNELQQELNGISEGLKECPAIEVSLGELTLVAA